MLIYLNFKTTHICFVYDTHRERERELYVRLSYLIYKARVRIPAEDVKMNNGVKAVGEWGGGFINM